MSKSNGGIKVPSFCLARIKPQVHMKSHIAAAPAATPTKQINQKDDTTIRSMSSAAEEDKLRNLSQKKIDNFAGRKIMIVVDSSNEAKAALQWAVTHTIQNTDFVTLLHVVSSNKLFSPGRELNGEEIPSKVDELLKSMKKLCQSNKPEVKVEIQVVAGKDKGVTIVSEAKRKETGMLILGQKKRSATLRLFMMWTGGGRGGDGGGNSISGTSSVAEYCIHNAPCMTIGVRKKSRKHGGYLITTKRHKDFWLLA